MAKPRSEQRAAPVVVRSYPDVVSQAGVRGWKTAIPLGKDETAQASQVALRLRSEMRRLFDQLPANARTGIGLARHLGVDRGTATRFVNVCRKPLPELEILRQLPGVRGLTQVLDAMQEQGLPNGDLDMARTSVERFERLLQEHGGSQTKLAERIEATTLALEAAGTENSDFITRERNRLLFEASAEALGQRSTLRLVTQVFRPTPDKPGMMDQAVLRGTFGFRCRPDSPPYALRSYGKNDLARDFPEGEPGDREYATLEGRAATGSGGATIFKEFSSDPVPLVTTRGKGKEALIVVDPERSSNGEAVDFVMGHALLGNWGLPIHDEPPRHEVSTFIKSPSERMVMDVFLHRSMAGQCLPSLKLYMTSPGIFNNLEEHWYDQLPYAPRLQLLGSEPENLPSRYYPRHAELTRTFFNRLGWNHQDFIGFRCEVEYPFWGGFYVMIFDYSVAAEQQAEIGDSTD